MLTITPTSPQARLAEGVCSIRPFPLTMEPAGLTYMRNLTSPIPALCDLRLPVLAGLLGVRW